MQLRHTEQAGKRVGRHFKGTRHRQSPSEARKKTDNILTGRTLTRGRSGFQWRSKCLAIARCSVMAKSSFVCGEMDAPSIRVMNPTATPISSCMTGIRWSVDKRSWPGSVSRHPGGVCALLCLLRAFTGWGKRLIASLETKERTKAVRSIFRTPKKLNSITV